MSHFRQNSELQIPVVTGFLREPDTPDAFDIEVIELLATTFCPKGRKSRAGRRGFAVRAGDRLRRGPLASAQQKRHGGDRSSSCSRPEVSPGRPRCVAATCGESRKMAMGAHVLPLVSPHTGAAGPARQEYPERTRPWINRSRGCWGVRPHPQRREQRVRRAREPMLCCVNYWLACHTSGGWDRVDDYSVVGLRPRCPERANVSRRPCGAGVFRRSFPPAPATGGGAFRGVTGNSVSVRATLAISGGRVRRSFQRGMTRSNSTAEQRSPRPPLRMGDRTRCHPSVTWTRRRAQLAWR